MSNYNLSEPILEWHSKTKMSFKRVQMIKS